MNQPQPLGALAGSARLPANTVARELNAMPPPPRVALSCAADFDESYLLWFSYASGPRVLVLVSRGGCGSATNGDTTRAFASAALREQLDAALGHDTN